MKLIMAVSADGFVATGPDDDMSWTGYMDKSIFKLLTLTGNEPLLAGHATWQLLPKLEGRVVAPVTRRSGGLSLAEAHKQFPNTWLIGGQTIALAAIEFGCLDKIFLCYNTNVKLGFGITLHDKIRHFGTRVTSIDFPYKERPIMVEIRKKC